jgi:hypothetical protein
VGAPFSARRWQALADQQLVVSNQRPRLPRLHRQDDDGEQLAERLRLGETERGAPAA